MVLDKWSEAKAGKIDADMVHESASAESMCCVLLFTPACAGSAL